MSNAPSATTADYGTGFLEISEKGFGFLRTKENNYHPKPSDIFVTPDTIKRNFLREGCLVAGETQPPHRGNSPQLKTVDKVNEQPFEAYTKAVRFENLTTIDPIEKINLETSPDLLETRIIDLVTPIGKGTRGLIVAPPRTGKTTILKQIANAVTTNHPEVYAMVLLIDERPEEVTDFQRSVKAEVVASSNDQDLETHVRLSRFMIERCRRMVESGRDVFVLLDSITRVARAYNSVHGGSGRTMTGGVDARALEIPRKMFASARKIEEGGSLTIIATALVDTGSSMDELIFQEFKGTGNMELILERKLADRRLFPALDIPKSGTRKEEKLFPPKNIESIRKLRRMMVDLNPDRGHGNVAGRVEETQNQRRIAGQDHLVTAHWRPLKSKPEKTLHSRPPLERMLRIHQAIQSGQYPNAVSLARDLEVSSKSIHRDFEFMRDRLQLPLEYDNDHKGYYYTEEVSNFPTLQISEGRIVRPARRGKGPATIPRHHLRTAPAQRLQKNGRLPARHRVAQPGRLGADHFLPHQRRADPESGNLRHPGQSHRAAQTIAIDLSQTRPPRNRTAPGRSLSPGQHQRRMVSLRLVPSAPRHSHLRPGAHSSH